MTVSAYKRAAVCAMTQFGVSDQRVPTASQVAAVESYFVATKAKEYRERYIACLRIHLKCAIDLQRQQHAKVYGWLEIIAAREVPKSN